MEQVSMTQLFHTGKRSPQQQSEPKKVGGMSQTKNNLPDQRLSFLFVITELVITHTFTDSWGHPGPPDACGAYSMKEERPSGVMRYDNGIVQPAAQQFFWYRDAISKVGRICHMVENVSYAAKQYSQAAVFSCSPLMPFAMVKTDPSVHPTYYHGELSDEPVDHKWQPLQFFFPLGPDRKPTGVSQAVFSSSLTAAHVGGAPKPFAAGKNASWLGTLVPDAYDNPYGSAPKSAGLGGELTILLALMTFTAPPETDGTWRAHRVFLGPNARWKNEKWLHRDKPGGWTRSIDERPQGVLVTVSLDPHNPQGSTREKLAHFEFFGDPAVSED